MSTSKNNGDNKLDYEMACAVLRAIQIRRKVERWLSMSATGSQRKRGHEMSNSELLPALEKKSLEEFGYSGWRHHHDDNNSDIDNAEHNDVGERNAVDKQADGGLSTGSGQPTSYKRRRVAVNESSAGGPIDKTRTQYHAPAYGTTNMMLNPSRVDSDAALNSQMEPIVASPSTDVTQRIQATPQVDGILWGGIQRYPRRMGPDAINQKNDTLYREVTAVVAGRFYSGYDTPIEHLTMWPRNNSGALLYQITKDWKVRRETIVREHWHAMNEGVVIDEDVPTKSPNKVEISIIQARVNEFRACWLRKVRDIVRSYYDFAGTADAKERVAELLKDDQFTCNASLDENNSTGYQRWLSPILYRSIAALFYGSGRCGLATSPLTRSYFESFSLNPLLITATMVYHTISEYESGSRLIKDFRKQQLTVTYERLLNTWNQQTPECERLTMKILSNRVAEEVAASKEAAAANKTISRQSGETVYHHEYMNLCNRFRVNELNPPNGSNNVGTRGTQPLMTVQND